MKTGLVLEGAQSGNGRTAKAEAILGKPTKTKHCNY